MEKMNEQQLTPVESALTTALLPWSASSVAVAAALAVAGRAFDSDEVLALSRQTSSWSAIDALIAAAGVLSTRRRGPSSDNEADKKIRSLRTLLLVSAAADVGYIAGGPVPRCEPEGHQTGQDPSGVVAQVPVRSGLEEAMRIALTLDREEEINALTSGSVTSPTPRLPPVDCPGL